MFKISTLDKISEKSYLLYILYEAESAKSLVPAWRNLFYFSYFFSFLFKSSFCVLLCVLCCFVLVFSLTARHSPCHFLVFFVFLSDGFLVCSFSCLFCSILGFATDFHLHYAQYLPNQYVLSLFLCLGFICYLFVSFVFSFSF